MIDAWAQHPTAHFLGQPWLASLMRWGKGSLPTTDLESFACALEESLAEPLRRGDPPVIGIVRDGVLLLDCRTLTDEEVEVAARAVNECRSR